MNYTYKEIINISYKALDLIPDLKKYLKINQAPQSIMTEIRDAFYYHIYDNTPIDIYLKENDNFFEHDIFNWLSIDEFIEYCKIRFPEVKWQSEIIERFWIVEVGEPLCN